MTSQKANISVSWRVIAVVSLVVNGALIATLATVAGVNGADALSTIALALAILAFVSQIMIFIWQTVQGTAQLGQAQELNTSTLGLVADAKTRIDGTYDMVRAQHDELLKLTSLKAAAEDAKSEVSGEPVVAPVLDEEIEPSPLPAPVPVRGEGRIPLVRVPATPKAELQKIFGWPNTAAELEPILSELEELEDHDLDVLSITTFDDANSRVNGFQPGLTLASIDEPLIAKGWSMEGPPLYDAAGKPTRRVLLSPLGANYGRLFIAPWPPPAALSSFKDRLWALRNRLDEEVQTRAGRSTRQIFDD